MNEKLLQMDTSLQFLLKDLEEVQGGWDGDSPIGEDKATWASDVIEKVKELRVLLNEYSDL